jgi:flagellum-specific peptidoglycan hydrolase FlgJ
MLAKNLYLLRSKCNAAFYRYAPTFRRWLPRLLIVFLIWLLFVKDRFSIQIHIGNPDETTPKTEQAKTKSFETQRVSRPSAANETPASASVLPFAFANPATATSAALTEAQKKQALQYSNLGFALNPDYASKNNISPAIVAYKQQKCLDYIQNYLSIAQEEQQLYGIPAAITLAQALLESNAGDSNLAQLENNHFGLKCSKKCTTCRCAKYTDDTPNDLFQVFDTPWFSFRAHSKLLQTDRYRHLLQLPTSDYQNWAYGLQAAGYATDPKYAKKLIAIIEAFQLHKY